MKMEYEDHKKYSSSEMEKTKILIVEDDRYAAIYIKQALRALDSMPLISSETISATGPSARD
jgi:hypothetical protein